MKAATLAAYVAKAKAEEALFEATKAENLVEDAKVALEAAGAMVKATKAEAVK